MQRTVHNGIATGEAPSARSGLTCSGVVPGVQIFRPLKSSALRIGFSDATAIGPLAAHSNGSAPLATP